MIEIVEHHGETCRRLQEHWHAGHAKTIQLIHHLAHTCFFFKLLIGLH